MVRPGTRVGRHASAARADARPVAVGRSALAAVDEVHGASLIRRDRSVKKPAVLDAVAAASQSRLPRMHLALALLLALPGATRQSPFEVHYAVDGGLTAAALVAGGLFALLPVDTTRRWETELLPFDEAVKQNLSSGASTLSDALVTVTAAAPLATQLEHGVNAELGRRSLVYAETLAVAFAFNSAAKFVVQRPRPYVYNPHVGEAGIDSRLSFYSGHASLAFSSAVAGGYLFGATSGDSRARALFWGLELALATATANLRVRAGRHFYSDVIVGALVGAGLGVLVPWLHQEAPGRYRVRAEELYAMAAGVLAGAAASQLPSFEPEHLAALGIELRPLPLEGGAGTAVALRW